MQGMYAAWCVCVCSCVCACACALCQQPSRAHYAVVSASGVVSESATARESARESGRRPAAGGGSKSAAEHAARFAQASMASHRRGAPASCNLRAKGGADVDGHEQINGGEGVEDG